MSIGGSASDKSGCVTSKAPQTTSPSAAFCRCTKGIRGQHSAKSTSRKANENLHQAPSFSLGRILDRRAASTLASPFLLELVARGAGDACHPGACMRLGSICRRSVVRSTMGLDRRICAKRLVSICGALHCLLCCFRRHSRRLAASALARICLHWSCDIGRGWLASHPPWSWTFAPTTRHRFKMNYDMARKRYTFDVWMWVLTAAILLFSPESAVAARTHYSRSSHMNIPLLRLLIWSVAIAVTCMIIVTGRKRIVWLWIAIAFACTVALAVMAFWRPS